MEVALILVRLGQYLGAAGLFGGALFLVRHSPEPLDGPGRRVLLVSALALAGATLASLFVQAAIMGGRSDPWSDPAMVGMVMTQTPFGYAVCLRLVASIGATVVWFATPTLGRLRLLAGLGAVATVTLAWGGHGVADERLAGAIHLTADVVHLLAAAFWIGALAMLGLSATDRRTLADPASARGLHTALKGFSGAGTLAVALLVGTGLINGGFLIGLGHAPALLTTPYGRIFLAKLLLFAGMLALAAANRWSHTPRLNHALARADLASALPRLRRSLVLETTAAVGVVVLVAWLGTLAPPMSN